jgi:hypothetical protein
LGIADGFINGVFFFSSAWPPINPEKNFQAQFRGLLKTFFVISGNSMPKGSVHN